MTVPEMDVTATHPWAVMLEPGRQRWGGDLRRMHLFRRLAEITQATVLDGFDQQALRRAFGRARVLPAPFGLLARGPRPRLASAEQLHPAALRLARRVLDPAAVAVYDDPVAQAYDLGIVLQPVRRDYFAARKRANLSAFRWHVVPTESFAEHIGLDMSRVIVAGNGTDTSRVVPGDWPDDPAIGMISGAAPGRGIEALIAAARQVHDEVPELRLLLWLAPTGEDSQAYLSALERSIARERWIELWTASYEDLTHALRQATALVIPHPPGDYHDIALPVKLLDSMAAGRPVVVTPRTEVRAVVERHGVGIVTDGETVDDLANSLRVVVRDDRLARELGAHARRVAVEKYDWDVVGDRVAEAVMEREGISRYAEGAEPNVGGSSSQSS